MVARALLLRPKLLVADEPVSMIDASLRALVLGSLRSLNTDFGIPIVYITHDLTTAYHVAHSIIVLYRGEVVEAGDAGGRHPRRCIRTRGCWSIRFPGPISRRAGATRRRSRGIAAATANGCAFAPAARASCRAAAPSARPVRRRPAPGRALPAARAGAPCRTRNALGPLLHLNHCQRRPAMKITALRTLVVAAPPHRNWVFVKVETDQPGLYGWGEGTLEWKTRGVVGTVEDFAPIVVGQDPRDITRIVELLTKTAFWPLGVIGLTASAPSSRPAGTSRARIWASPSGRCWAARCATACASIRISAPAR